MPDLSALRELAPQVVPPGLDDLVGVERRRRGRAMVAAVALGVAVVAGLVAGQAPGPSQSVEPVAPPLQGRIADGRLEISADGFRTSASHDWAKSGAGGSYNPLIPFDDEHLLVYDFVRANNGATTTRYRLLGAPGTPAIELKYDDKPVATAPDPNNIVVSTELLRVDKGAATIAPVAGTGSVTGTWGPDVRTHLWRFGFNSCRVDSQQPDGAWHTEVLACRGHALTLPYEDRFRVPAFFTDERLALAEMADAGWPVAVHVSMDAGLTWERIPVSPPDGPIFGPAQRLLDSLE